MLDLYWDNRFGSARFSGHTRTICRIEPLRRIGLGLNNRGTDPSLRLRSRRTVTPVAPDLALLRLCPGRHNATTLNDFGPSLHPVSWN